MSAMCAWNEFLMQCLSSESTHLQIVPRRRECATTVVNQCLLICCVSKLASRLARQAMWIRQSDIAPICVWLQEHAEDRWGSKGRPRRGCHKLKKIYQIQCVNRGKISIKFSCCIETSRHNRGFDCTNKHCELRVCLWGCCLYFHILPSSRGTAPMLLLCIV